MDINQTSTIPTDFKALFRFPTGSRIMYPLVYFWTDRDRNNGRSETEAKSVPGKRSANRADEPEAVARVRIRDPENRAAGAFFGVRSRDRHNNKKGKAPRCIASRPYRCLYGALLFSTPDHCAAYIRGCMNRYYRSLRSLPKKHMLTSTYRDR